MRAPWILDDVVVPAEYPRINDGTGPSVQGERESAMDMVGPLGQCGDLAERSMARNSQIFPGSVVARGTQLLPKGAVASNWKRRRRRV